MNFVIHSHRYAEELLDRNWRTQWEEVKSIISSVSDDELIVEFGTNRGATKSLSAAINAVLKRKLEGAGWDSESPIFQEADSERWRLDFAKQDISIEVAFNHGEAVAWNLLKPVLASELNHVRKAIQTKVGIIIFATDELKEKGGFDSAVGTFEKAKRYLRPLNNILSVPIAVIGLLAPSSFYIRHERSDSGRMTGLVCRYYPRESV
jgi:hypothetical protein